MTPRPTTEAQMRLRILKAAGWDEKRARRYIRRHKKPQLVIEWIGLAWWNFKKYWRL